MALAGAPPSVNSSNEDYGVQPLKCEARREAMPIRLDAIEQVVVLLLATAPGVKAW